MLFGADPVDLPALPPAPKEPVLRTLGAQRTVVLEAARKLLDATLTLDFEGMRPLLAPRVWVLWPDGRCREHAREPLLALLSQRSGRAFPAMPDQLRIYSSAEIKQATAAGVTEALETLCGPAAAWVTARLDAPRRVVGRIVLLMDEVERWQSRTLILPAADDAWIQSISPSTLDDPAQLAARWLRHLHLGHHAQLRSLRNQTMPQVWFKDGLIAAEKLTDPATFSEVHADWVLKGAEICSKWAEPLGPKARSVEQKALSAWKLKLEAMSPKLVTVAWSGLEPQTLRPSTSQLTHVLMLRILERDAARRDKPVWRVAGVFNE